MTLSYYLGLLDHEDRIEAIRRGIEDAVEDGDRVLDLGCGLGTFSFFAARAGAERVAAVDADPVVHVARSVARANGLEDRIDFVRGRIPDVDVGHDFDVLVFEDFPGRLLDDRTYRLLRRVHRELLAPGARIVPRMGRVCLAPVRAERPNAGGTGSAERARRYGIDWSPLAPYLANEPRSVRLPADALLAPPAEGSPLSLLAAPGAADLAVEGRWSLGKGARVDGLLLWFDLEVAPEEWISNAPGPGAGPWGQLLLLLDPPLRAGEGGTLEAAVRREAFSDGAPGWLSWRAVAGESESREGHEFAAYPAALQDLYPDDGGPGRGGSPRGSGPEDGASHGPGRGIAAVDGESDPVEDS